MRILILLLIIGGSYSCKEQPQVSADDVEQGAAIPGRVSADSIGLNLDGYFTSLTQLGRFNGVVLIRDREELLLHKAYNMGADSTMDPDLTPTLPVTLHSQFDLRSIAKLFAKVAVLEMEREGLLGLEDPISKYIPDFPRGDEITITHLMDHRSGLPRELDEPNTLELTAEEIVDLAKLAPLEFEPGKDQRYSNVGFQLLYYLIGKVSGQPFREVLKERYFDPLQMKGTGSNFMPELRIPDHYAYGHFQNNADRLVAITGFLKDETQMGNFHSTAGDMDRYLNSLDSVSVSSLLKEGSLGHAGGTKGKRAYVFRDFTKGYSIVFLSNYDGIPFERLVADLEAIVEGRPVEMPGKVNRSAIVLDPGVLRRYVGTYDFVDAGHLVIDIRLERDTLWVYQEGENNGPLFPESETVFFGDPTSEESFEFVRDSNGLYYSLMDFQGVRWTGIPLD